MTEHAFLAFAALTIEAAVGYPAWLFRRIGHPVTWIGALITVLELRLNNAQRGFAERKAAGVLAVLILVGIAFAAAAMLAALEHGWLGILVVACLAASLPAQRSLYVHVADVAHALDRDGISGGRLAVSKIVGRDVAALDESGIARAAIESLAENFSDGVVAPLFWLVVLRLPGAVVYKAINTADSMIGHRSERYAAFGWAAARLDDLVNLPASRLSVVWLILAAALLGLDVRGGLRAVARDAGHHRSPNAGWPEAAMAGALGIALSGPRVYGGVRVEDRFIGGARRDVSASDIRRALRLYCVACAIEGVAILALGCLTVRG